jgi:hypothetical protein
MNKKKKDTQPNRGTCDITVSKTKAGSATFDVASECVENGSYFLAFVI